MDAARDQMSSFGNHIPIFTRPVLSFNLVPRAFFLVLLLDKLSPFCIYACPHLVGAFNCSVPTYA